MLEVLVNGLRATLQALLQRDGWIQRGARPTCTTREVIALHDPKAGAERWVPNDLAARGRVDRAWWNCMPSVRLRDELRSCPHPGTEPARKRFLQDGGGLAANSDRRGSRP